MELNLNIEIDKNDIIALIKGSKIPFGMINTTFKDYVTYRDCYGSLSWDKKSLYSLSENELYAMYLEIKSEQEKDPCYIFMKKFREQENEH